MGRKPLIPEELETCFSVDRAPPSTPLSHPHRPPLLSSPLQCRGPLSSDLTAGILGGSPSLPPPHGSSFLLQTHPSLLYSESYKPLV